MRIVPSLATYRKSRERRSLSRPNWIQRGNATGGLNGRQSVLPRMMHSGAPRHRMLPGPHGDEMPSSMHKNSSSFCNLPIAILRLLNACCFFCCHFRRLFFCLMILASALPASVSPAGWVMSHSTCARRHDGKAVDWREKASLRAPSSASLAPTKSGLLA